jgi:hypothetical protein
MLHFAARSLHLAGTMDTSFIRLMMYNVRMLVRRHVPSCLATINISPIHIYVRDAHTDGEYVSISFSRLAPF